MYSVVFWFKITFDHNISIIESQARASPVPSPSRSPIRSPSPFTNISMPGEDKLSVSGVRKVSSAKSLSGMDKVCQKSYHCNKQDLHIKIIIHNINLL